MDITLFPPSLILSRHSHQIYHPPPLLQLLPAALLASPMSKRNMSEDDTIIPRGSGFNSYRYRRRARDCPAPADGSSPISRLPNELWLNILKFLNWQELLALRSVNKHLSELALTPSLHHTLSFTTLPLLPLPRVLAESLLPSVRHLSFHLFPYPTTPSLTTAVVTLLKAIPPGQLQSLSIPFSAPYLPLSDLSEILPRLGSRLEKLDLRGSAITGRKWVEWMGSVGKDGQGIRYLDLGFTTISTLPPLPQIESLSLSSCVNLSSRALALFLANLPPNLTSLDLSRLEQIPFAALWDMRVTRRLESETVPTKLANIKLVGIDHLTRLDVRRLKRHWESQRRACATVGSEQNASHASVASSRMQWALRSDQATDKTSGADTAINISHSAILESEDEAGYRQFIGEVAGAVVLPVSHRDGEAVEVDQGGLL